MFTTFYCAEYKWRYHYIGTTLSYKPLHHHVWSQQIYPNCIDFRESLWKKSRWMRMDGTSRLSRKLCDYILHNTRIWSYFYVQMSNDKSHRVTRHSVWDTKVVIQKLWCLMVLPRRRWHETPYTYVFPACEGFVTKPFQLGLIKI